jgi:hypothetical protein
MPQSSRVQVVLPDGEQTWRMDGRAPLELKAAIARRLAVCWNVCEGFPTDQLELGILKELCDAVAAGDIAKAQEALARMDRGTDTTDGRLHDCKPCLAREESADA